MAKNEMTYLPVSSGRATREKKQSSVNIMLDKNRQILDYAKNLGIPFTGNRISKKRTDIEKIWDIAYGLWETSADVSLVISYYTIFVTAGIEVDCKDKDVKEYFTNRYLKNSSFNFVKLMQQFIEHFQIFNEATNVKVFDEDQGIVVGSENILPFDLESEKIPFSGEYNVYTNLQKSSARSLYGEIEDRNYKEKLRQVLGKLVEKEDKRGRGRPASQNNMKKLCKELTTRVVGSLTSYGFPNIARSYGDLILLENFKAAQKAMTENWIILKAVVECGMTAQESGTGGAAIPTPAQLDTLCSDFQEFLAADEGVYMTGLGFRVTTPFAQVVQDYSAQEDHYLRSYYASQGLPDLFQGATQSTYASAESAKDIFGQRVTQYSEIIKKFAEDHFRLECESQCFYDYNINEDGQKEVIMEEVWKKDSEGGRVKVKVPKLIPVSIKTYAMLPGQQDILRQEMSQLIQMGYPISKDTAIGGLKINLQDEEEKLIDEKVDELFQDIKFKRSAAQRFIDEGMEVPPEFEQFIPKKEQEKDQELPENVGGQIAGEVPERYQGSSLIKMFDPDWHPTRNYRLSVTREMANEILNGKKERVKISSMVERKRGTSSIKNEELWTPDRTLKTNIIATDINQDDGDSEIIY